MPQPQGRTIKLGKHDYVVFPQKIGYLMNQLGPHLQEALEAQLKGADILNLAGVKAHAFLRIFIPDLMPVHEFCGFASSEAHAKGQAGYVEEDDHSPDSAQVRQAFIVVNEVNGGELLSRLKALAGLIDPDMIRKGFKLLAATIAETRAQAIPSTTSPTPESSPTSPPESGESPPTSSGTPPQTSEPSAV